MGLLNDYFNNTRKPIGFMGKMMVTGMNAGHTKMAHWGISTLPAIEPSSIVDLGCGGGKNAEEMMEKFPSAKMTAVDYSDVCVESARKRNADEIAKGRCKVIQGDVSDLPLKDKSCDFVTAFETVYFWPGPVKSFKEAYRILRTGGAFLIVNECDGTNEKDQKWVDIIEGMRIYPENEMVQHLKDVGFADVQVSRNKNKHWIAFLAHKA